MRHACLAVGAIVLGVVWLGPFPQLAPRYFSAHMTMHMGVVAVAAPLLALGVAGGPLDPVRRSPVLFAAIPAAVLELVVVWAWHAPALHHLARGSTAGLVTEQGMFLTSALLVWLSAIGGGAPRAGGRAAAGVVALLLTSMHMTLLGALLAMSTRPLYAHGAGAAADGAPLHEQHLGGAIMLLAGGISYLAGGLGLTTRLLGTPTRAAQREHA